jgi:hypothetical protein
MYQMLRSSYDQLVAEGGRMAARDSREEALMARGGET